MRAVKNRMRLQKFFENRYENDLCPNSDLLFSCIGGGRGGKRLVKFFGEHSKLFKNFMKLLYAKKKSKIHVPKTDDRPSWHVNQIS